MWLFPKEGVKGKRKPRLVFLSDEAQALTKKWVERRSDDPIFRNARGRPWTARAFNNRFCKLKEKIGGKVCMYASRHTYAHMGLTTGDVKPEVVAALLGHSDTGMIYKVYGHPLENTEFMRKAAAKARK